MMGSKSMAAARTRDVGIVGLGQMGRGIARALDHGGRLGAAWDVSPSAIAAAQLSADVAIMPPSVFGAMSVVIFVVPSSAEIDAALNGPDGLLAKSHPGQILVDLTTSHPSATLRLAAQAADAGRAYVDCGMSGGAAAADAGKVTLMIGGSREAVDTCAPIFDLFAGQRTHVGGSGAGHTIKLVHNMICHSIFLVTAEGCRMAERAGIELSTAVAVLNSGNARSFISEVRFPRHVVSGTFDGRSRIWNLEKDLGMAAELAVELGQPAVYAPLAAAMLTTAARLDSPERDFTTLYRDFDRIVDALGRNEA